MATIFDQIKEQGLKQTVVATANETVERLTAGMNITDIRSALRGDAARRPNPRLRPHSDGFWFHIRPSFYHTEVTHIYPTFRMGWLSTFMFLWELITGIFLMVFYTPEPDTAYSDMWNIMSNVPLGQFMRNLHRFGAEVMVLVVALHMLRTYITGSYKKPRQFTWFTGMVLLCLTLILSFSGYLLPWDQLAFWAVTVAVSAAEAAPGPEALGANINMLIRGAPVIGAGGLLRFYLLHVLALPLLTGIFIFVHYYKVVLHGHSLPPGREAIGEDTARRVPKDERVYFIPEIFTNELMWTALTILFLVGGAIFLPVGIGKAAIETHANSGVTPLHVVAPWYLSWSQGWLKLATKEAIAFGFIPVLAGLFFAWSYLDVFNPSRRYADRRGGLALCAFFIAFMLVSNYMGSPEFLVRGSSVSEIASEVMPQEGHSHILMVPFDQLQPGTYYPNSHLDEDEFAEMNHALHSLDHAITRFSCKMEDQSTYDAEIHEELPVCEYEGRTSENVPFYTNSYQFKNVMVNPEVKMVITNKQANMRQITLQFYAEHPDVDDNPLAGTASFDEPWTKYRHEDSYYEGY